MRKRLAIVGHSEEGLSLIPLLEANPDVEVCAVISDDPSSARAALASIEADLDRRYSDRLTSDTAAVLRTPGLVALIEADPPATLRAALQDALEIGIQVTTPLIARLLYAFGPVDASRKPDLLHTLGEILESYNLTVDRRGLLSRILQIAVGATGADRGSLMLYDAEAEVLAVEVAIGIEQELIPKIRIRPGEGIAGLAFEGRQAILMHGKADQQRYRIVRERDDVESAISAPLIYDGDVLGVLNLSHARQRGAFDQEDLQFVEQLAALDAKIIARAERYHELLRDSAQLRAESEVRRLLGSEEPLAERLSAICAFVSDELDNGICHMFMHDSELDTMVLHSSSIPLDPLTSPIRLDADSGIHGFVVRSRQPVFLSQTVAGLRGCFAVVPLLARGELLGLLSVEGMLTPDAAQLVREKIEAVSKALASELSDALRGSRIEHEATRMTAITEAASLMNGAEDAAELQPRITSSVAMILEAEHALLRLQDEASGRFQIRSYFGSAETDAQSALFALEKKLSIQAIKERSPVRLLDLDQCPELAAYEAGVKSTLVQTLQHGNRVVGTLSVLGKIPPDSLAAEHFTQADESILAHFVEHAQQALARLRERDVARHQQRFDELTGLPNALHLRERLEQELSRSASRGAPILLVRLQVGGLADLLAGQPGLEGDRLTLSIAQELRAALRDFDVLGRTAPDTFEALIPEPDRDISSLLGPLARRAHESIRRELDPELGARLTLRFGYARYPEDGRLASQLQDKAREPRIVSD